MEVRMRVVTTLFILLLLSVAAVEAVTVESCVVPAGVTATRPDPDGVPTRVTVGIYLIDLRKLNDTDQSFEADFILILIWKDPRLGGLDAESSLVGCGVDLKDIWDPHAVILNDRNLVGQFEAPVRIEEGGVVRYAQRFQGELTTPLDLRDYPFDSQQLRLELVAAGFSPEEVEFVTSPEVGGRSENLTIADWSVGGKGDVATEPLFLAAQKRYLPRILYRLTVTRNRGYFVIKVLIPLSLIVCMSWAVFWINPHHLPAQIGVSTSAVLTLIAFQFSLGYLLPRVSYLTRADRFVMGSAVLVFLAFGEALLTASLADRDKDELAHRIDARSRIIFPLAFIVVVFVSFVV
jgi:hypothetical protein